MPDYIPSPDAEFDNWLDNFTTKVVGTPTAFGLVAGDVTGLSTASADWKTKYPAHIAAGAAAGSARAAKDGSRLVAVSIVRGLVRRIQASPATDDADRATLQITVPGENTGPGGPPDSMPIVKVECERLRHTLKWSDVNTPTSRAKPPGVLGVEIKMALTPIGGATPTDPSLFNFLALDTATPYVNDFSGGDGGKNAHYIARWINGANEHGPWSETVSVTVGV